MIHPAKLTRGLGLLVFWSCSQLAHAVGEPVECDGAPKEAVLRFPEPVNQWALIFCSPDGHVIAPVDGYIWLAKNKRPFLFNSLSASGQRVRNQKHGAYFVAQSHLKMEGDLLSQTRKMFELEFDQKADEYSVDQVDVQSLGGLRYNLFFYTKNGKLTHVIGCMNECQQSVGLRQLSLDEARTELQRR